MNIPLLPYYYVLTIAEDASGDPVVFLNTIHGSRNIPENFLVLANIPLQENIQSFFFPVSGMKFLLVTITYLLSSATEYGKNLRMIESLFTRRLQEKLSGENTSASPEEVCEFRIPSIPGFGDFMGKMLQPFLSDAVKKTQEAIEKMLDIAVEYVQKYSSATTTKNAP